MAGEPTDGTEGREARRKRRESVLRKVRALLKLTVDNGATELEAMKAAAKAAELMAAHDLDMDDVDVRESGTRSQECGLDPVRRAHLTRVANAIAKLVGARFWVNGSGAAATKGTFFGLPHDVEVAGYLLDVCENAMRRDTQAFLTETGFVLLERRFRERKADAFMAGMADRLSERIREMAPSRKATGTALVPLKDALIEEALKSENAEFKGARVGRRDVDPLSFRKGRAAGDRVGLRSGLGGPKDAKPVR